VFASGKNRTVAGKPLHTNFSLSGGSVDGSCSGGGGEYLGLTSRGGVALPPAWEPYPGQANDVSFGLTATDPAATTAYFAKPTPGAPNDLSSALAERVEYMPTSGTFAAATPISVSLKTKSTTATIRYTTNRQRPIGVPGRLGMMTVDATSDVCTLTGHGFTSGELVHASGPAPLDARVNYFVKVIDADTFKLAIEPGGPTIDLQAGGMVEIRREAVTASAATSGVFTSTTIEHGFLSGDNVQVKSTGALPGGLLADTPYYVVVTAANTFTLSASPTLTPNVAITTAGNVTVYRMPSPAYSTPIPVAQSTLIRSRAFENGRPDGPIRSEMYFALDAAAQAVTSTLPIVLSHTFNTAIQNNNTPVKSYLMIFEPKAPDMLSRMTNPPDLVSQATLERHGSSTSSDDKFSMAVELQDEQGLDQDCKPLGMPANSDWLMHAPYFWDPSMMHNDLMYRLSNQIGRYAPRTRYVEHFHNERQLPNTIEGVLTGTTADYFGVYSFMDKITRGKNRVDIDNLTITDNAAPEIQGGYMFKCDRLDGSETGIRPLAGQTFGGAGFQGPGNDILAWVNPREISLDPFKVVTSAQSLWFRGHLGEAYAALNGAMSTDPVNGYAKYWDVPATIDHHIMNTLTKNADAFRLSSYWYKPRFGKLTAAPLWDFDRAEGSRDGRDRPWNNWLGGGTSFFTYPWYVEMFRDPNFWQLWIDRYEQLRQGVFSTANIHAQIDDFASQLNPGDAASTPAKRSIARWVAGAPVPASTPRPASDNAALGYTNNTFNGQYTGEVAWLKYWWQKRLEFADSQFTRPAVASVPAGMVTAGTTVTLTSPSQSTPGVEIFYTTDGTDPRMSGGNPAANATLYTAPIVINGPVKLFVRVRHPAAAKTAADTGVPFGSRWSAPSQFTYTTM
ncbi:MAG TPA: CotH kinase family protein, partial [Pseudomonadota bacterium]|nr:CotH kinase family protein [Pseudomonadota bacterium]